MNQRIQRLAQLLQLKEEATRKAYYEFLKTREQVEQNRLKQEQLSGYKGDYLKQFEVLGREGASVDRLRNRLNFISHLDVVLSQLKVFLDQLSNARARAELAYKQAKIAEEGVSKLIDRAKKAEQVKQERLEQKESDEYAQKQWYGKKESDR
jgi:flagellar FliJ protein